MRPPVLSPFTWLPSEIRAGDVSGLYLHVPFCQSDCAYCAFAREVPAHRGVISEYLDALALEAEHWRAEFGRPLTPETVFIGGGTPSFLDRSEWGRLVDALDPVFDRTRLVELTIEANPDSLDDGVLERFASFGVTRLSLGAQSSHASLLTFLGRTHSWAGVRDAFARARSVPGLVVNVDLIYGIPGLSPAKWSQTLDAVLDLSPDHLSAYCLSFEEGTSLTKRRGTGAFNDQSDGVQRAAYDTVVARARAHGLDRYEVSNFGTPRSMCRHNLLYWRRGTYLGLGPSAHSSLGGRRFWNHSRRERWAGSLRDGTGPVRGSEVVDGARSRAETLMQLRLADGVPRSQLPAAGSGGRGLWRRIGDFEAERLVVVEPDRVRLDDAAFFVSDGITAELMAAWDGEDS